MRSQKTLIVIYLCALLASAFSSVLQIDRQSLLRMPILNVRYIDIVILYFVIVTLNNLYTKENIDKKLSSLQWLIIIYLVIEIFQFVRTFGVIDVNAQISWLLSSSAFCVLFMSYNKISIYAYHKLILNYSVAAVIVLSIIVILSFGGLESGVAVNESGRLTSSLYEKEIISPSVLLPIVFVFSLIARFLKISKAKKVILSLGIIPIFVSLVTSYHRGTLAMMIIVLMLIYPIIHFNGKSRVKYFNLILGSVVVLLIFYSITVSELSKYGFEPIKQISDIAEYSIDYNNNNWDKGRFYVQYVALKIWGNNPVLGTGYDSLSRYLPNTSAAHNFIISSLFHRGILGTIVLSMILMICYYEALKLWKFSRKVSEDERIINRGLVLTSLVWIIPLMTQEVLWEKYSTSIQLLYFSIIISINHIYEKRNTESLVRCY